MSRESNARDGHSNQPGPPASVDHHHRVRAAIRAVVAFALVWAVLSLASWLILPRLTGSDAEWVVPATAALMFLIAACTGWVEYMRALRRLRSDADA